MHIKFSTQIRRYLRGIAFAGMLLILCSGMSGLHAAHVRAAVEMASKNVLIPENTSKSDPYDTHIFPFSLDGNIWIGDEINGTQQQLTYNGTSFSPILAPDGSRIAYIANSQDHQPGDAGSANINIIDVDGKNPISLAMGAGLVSLPSWSPDSKQLAFVKGTRLITVNLQDLSSRVLSDKARFDQGLGIPNPAWSPSGKTLLCVLQEGQFSQLWSIDVDTGAKKLVNTTKYEDAPYGFSPAGDITYIQKDTNSKSNLYLISAGLEDRLLL
jgi:Tol biopolymer transport system component